MKGSPKPILLMLAVVGITVLATYGVLSWFIKSPAPQQAALQAPSAAATPVAPTPAALASPAYDAQALTQKVVRDCPTNEHACQHEALLAITERLGPKASLAVLHNLQGQSRAEKPTDGHHLAHEIGKKTAQHFGINGQAFLLCPTAFNYGCQHGFFQYALGQAGAPAATARQICGSLGPSSAKFVFYCYHGVGHGVMMAQEYDLKKALAACDTFDSRVGQDGCWQGVFMENVNEARRGNRQLDGFSEQDPLAPCNVVADKHRYECFVNHAGWLIMYFHADVEKATRACLRAPAMYVSPCLQSIGLMVTNPLWQPKLVSSDLGRTAFERVAWDLCLKFPDSHREQCVIGAVDNIMNFDEFDVSRVRMFCETADAAYRDVCYRQIGLALRQQATDPEQVRSKCALFGEAENQACRQGGGV